MRRSSGILNAVVKSAKRYVPATQRHSVLEEHLEHRGRMSMTATHSLSCPGFGGECLLFLSCAHQVPVSCKAPVMMAWAEKQDGTVVGNKAEWMSKPGNRDPAWSISKPLGFKLRDHLDAVIVLELTDKGKIVGIIKVPIKDLLGKELQVFPLGKPPKDEVLTQPDKKEKGNTTALGRIRTGFMSAAAKDESVDEEDPCRVQFQVVDASELRHKRTCFFVRHAESAWNNAQSKNNFIEMFKTTDHPLSPTGGDQAEKLSTRIKAMFDNPAGTENKGGLQNVKSASKSNASTTSTASQMQKTKLITDPDVIYVSPLTRAVQTAVIALQPVITAATTHVELVLMSNAREKQNFGGLDTKSNTTGADVAQRALDETRTLFESRKTKESVIDSFRQIKFDVQEVQEQWWHHENKESSSQLDQRLDDFMAQLLYTPHHSLVVVGHSHFFREVFRRYLSEEFVQRRPAFAAQLQHRKLMNCGVARLELDPTSDCGLPIADVELVLGTQLLPKKEGCCKRSCGLCCRRKKKSPDPINREHE